MKKKTIWHVSSNRWNSAVTEYALSSAVAMQTLGWEVYFSPLHNSLAEKRSCQYNLKGPSFKSFSFLAIPYFLKAYKEIKPDIVFVYGGRETTLSRFLPKKSKVVRFRGSDQDMFRKYNSLLYKISEGDIKAIVCPSSNLTRRFKELSSCPVYTVPIGLSTKIFSFSQEVFARKRTVNRPTVRIIGRFDPIKGHREFFVIFKKMLDVWQYNSPFPYLEIIGNQENVTEKMLKDYADKAGLKLGVDWGLIPKRIENICESMIKTDLGVVSSLGSEVICRVAQEFLLCGTPVGVSGVGALEEVLVENSFGVSYKNKSIAQTARLLADLLFKSWNESAQDKERRSLLAKDRFSLDCLGIKLEEILSNI